MANLNNVFEGTCEFERKTHAGVGKQCVQSVSSKGNKSLFSLEQIFLIFQKNKIKVTDLYYQQTDPLRLVEILGGSDSLEETN